VAAEWCSNCEGGVVYARGRCRHCYRYWMHPKHKGEERPLRLHDALLTRRIVRDLERRWLRPA
jgi:hypothetical protein